MWGRIRYFLRNRWESRLRLNRTVGAPSLSVFPLSPFTSVPFLPILIAFFEILGSWDLVTIPNRCGEREGNRPLYALLRDQMAPLSLTYSPGGGNTGEDNESDDYYIPGNPSTSGILLVILVFSFFALVFTLITGWVWCVSAVEPTYYSVKTHRRGAWRTKRVVPFRGFPHSHLLSTVRHHHSEG